MRLALTGCYHFVNKQPADVCWRLKTRFFKHLCRGWLTFYKKKKFRKPETFANVWTIYATCMTSAAQSRFIGGVFRDLSTLLPFSEAAFPKPSSVCVFLSLRWRRLRQSSICNSPHTHRGCCFGRQIKHECARVCGCPHARRLSDVHIYPKKHGFTWLPSCFLSYLFCLFFHTHTHPPTHPHTSTHTTYVFHRCSEVTHQRIPWDRLGFGFKVIFGFPPTDLCFSVFPHISSVTDCLSHLRANRTINPRSLHTS